MQLKIIVVDGERQYSDHVKNLAIEHWFLSVTLNPALFDGDCWSVVYMVESETATTAHVQLTSYKYSLFSHFSSVGRSLPSNDRAICYGVRSLTISSEGYVVLGRRSSLAGTLPGVLDMVPAGVCHLPEPKEVLEIEYEEELGINVLTSQLEYLGVLTAGMEQGNKLEFVYMYKTGFSNEAILERFNSAKDKHEHEEIVFVKSTLGQLEPVLTEITKKALAMYFGENGIEL